MSVLLLPGYTTLLGEEAEKQETTARREATREQDLGRAARREGDLAKAVHHLERAVEREVEELDRWKELAEVVAETGASTEVSKVKV